MPYEYKVVPAPKRGLKAKGLKSPQDRFAHALQTVMNTLGAEGWEYQRTDTLPSQEREGLIGKTTVYQNMLVFRRVAEAAPLVAVETVAEETPEVSEEEAAAPADETADAETPEVSEDTAPSEDDDAQQRAAE